MKANEPDATIMLTGRGGPGRPVVTLGAVRP